MGTGKYMGSIPKTNWRIMYPVVRDVLEKRLNTPLKMSNFIILVRVYGNLCFMPNPNDSLARHCCAKLMPEKIPEIVIKLFLPSPPPQTAFELYQLNISRSYSLEDNPKYAQLEHDKQKLLDEDQRELNQAYKLMDQNVYMGVITYYHPVSRTVRGLCNLIGDEIASKLANYIYYLQDVVKEAHMTKVPYIRHQLKRVEEFIGRENLDKWKALLRDQKSLSENLRLIVTKPPKHEHIRTRDNGKSVSTFLNPSSMTRKVLKYSEENYKGAGYRTWSFYSIRTRFVADPDIPEPTQPDALSVLKNRSVRRDWEITIFKTRIATMEAFQNQKFVNSPSVNTGDIKKILLCAIDEMTQQIENATLTKVNHHALEQYVRKTESCHNRRTPVVLINVLNWARVHRHSDHCIYCH